MTVGLDYSLQFYIDLLFRRNYLNFLHAGQPTGDSIANKSIPAAQQQPKSLAESNVFDQIHIVGSDYSKMNSNQYVQSLKTLL